MTPQDPERLRQHPDFIQLVRRKQRLTWTLTLAMLAIYYGFVLMMAFAPGVLAQPLNGGATSIGIPVAVVVILLSFIFTAYYVRQTNQVLDPLVAKLQQEAQQ
ncbi:Inner membrane protein YjcH [compost metagenome]